MAEKDNMPTSVESSDEEIKGCTNAMNLLDYAEYAEYDGYDGYEALRNIKWPKFDKEGGFEQQKNAVAEIMAKCYLEHIKKKLTPSPECPTKRVCEVSSYEMENKLKEEYVTDLPDAYRPSNSKEYRDRKIPDEYYDHGKRVPYANMYAFLGCPDMTQKITEKLIKYKFTVMNKNEVCYEGRLVVLDLKQDEQPPYADQSEYYEWCEKVNECYKPLMESYKKIDKIRLGTRIDHRIVFLEHAEDMKNIASHKNDFLHPDVIEAAKKCPVGEYTIKCFEHNENKGKGTWGKGTWGKGTWGKGTWGKGTWGKGYYGQSKE